MAIVEFKDVTRVYTSGDHELRALDGVNFTLDEGKVGMKDTMGGFLDMLDNDISNYETKVNLTENASKEDAVALAEKLNGDWRASSGISYKGKTVLLEIYNSSMEKIGFLTEEKEQMELTHDGVYLCLRLKDSA